MKRVDGSQKELKKREDSNLQYFVSNTVLEPSQFTHSARFEEDFHVYSFSDSFQIFYHDDTLYPESRRMSTGETNVRIAVLDKSIMVVANDKISCLHYNFDTKRFKFDFHDIFIGVVEAKMEKSKRYALGHHVDVCWIEKEENEIDKNESFILCTALCDNVSIIPTVDNHPDVSKIVRKQVKGVIWDAKILTSNMFVLIVSNYETSKNELRFYQTGKENIQQIGIFHRDVKELMMNKIMVPKKPENIEWSFVVFEGCRILVFEFTINPFHPKIMHDYSLYKKEKSSSTLVSAAAFNSKNELYISTEIGDLFRVTIKKEGVKSIPVKLPSPRVYNTIIDLTDFENEEGNDTLHCCKETGGSEIIEISVVKNLHETTPLVASTNFNVHDIGTVSDFEYSRKTQSFLVTQMNRYVDGGDLLRVWKGVNFARIFRSLSKFPGVSNIISVPRHNGDDANDQFLFLVFVGFTQVLYIPNEGASNEGEMVPLNNSKFSKEKTVCVKCLTKGVFVQVTLSGVYVVRFKDDEDVVGEIISERKIANKNSAISSCQFVSEQNFVVCQSISDEKGSRMKLYFFLIDKNNYKIGMRPLKENHNVQISCLSQNTITIPYFAAGLFDGRILLYYFESNTWRVIHQISGNFDTSESLFLFPVKYSKNVIRLISGTRVGDVLVIDIVITDSNSPKKVKKVDVKIVGRSRFKIGYKPVKLQFLECDVEKEKISILAFCENLSVVSWKIKEKKFTVYPTNLNNIQSLSTITMPGKDIGIVTIKGDNELEMYCSNDLSKTIVDRYENSGCYKIFSFSNENMFILYCKKSLNCYSIVLVKEFELEIQFTTLYEIGNERLMSFDYCQTKRNNEKVFFIAAGTDKGNVYLFRATAGKKIMLEIMEKLSIPQGVQFNERLRNVLVGLYIMREE